MIEDQPHWKFEKCQFFCQHLPIFYAWLASHQSNKTDHVLPKVVKHIYKYVNYSQRPLGHELYCTKTSKTVITRSD